MIRRIFTKNFFPKKDFNLKSYLVYRLVSIILKNGKRTVAQRILLNTFNFIAKYTSQDPLFILEVAIRNISPKIQIKYIQVGRMALQIPINVSRYQAVGMALRWLRIFSQKKKQIKKSFWSALATGIMEAAKGIGSAVKKEEIHKIAQTNSSLTMDD